MYKKILQLQWMNEKVLSVIWVKSDKIFQYGPVLCVIREKIWMSGQDIIDKLNDIQ